MIGDGRRAGGRPRQRGRRHRGGCRGKLALHGDAPVPGERVADGRRPDERPAAPALRVLDRLEQEGPIVVVTTRHPGVGGDGRGEISEQLPPDRHHRVLPGQRRELVPAGLRHGAVPVIRRSSRVRGCRPWRPGSRAKWPEEAAVRPRVAGAGALLLHHEEERIPVAVVVGGPDPLTVARRISLAPTGLPAAGPEDGPPRLKRLDDSVAVHPGHHQHRAAPVRLDDGGNQTVGVVLDPSQLFGAGDDGGDYRHAHMVGARARQSGSMATAAPV